MTRLCARLHVFLFSQLWVYFPPRGINLKINCQDEGHWTPENFSWEVFTVGFCVKTLRSCQTFSCFEEKESWRKFEHGWITHFLPQRPGGKGREGTGSRACSSLTNFHLGLFLDAFWRLYTLSTPCGRLTGGGVKPVEVEKTQEKQDVGWRAGGMCGWRLWDSMSSGLGSGFGSGLRSVCSCRLWWSCRRSVACSTAFCCPLHCWQVTCHVFSSSTLNFISFICMINSSRLVRWCAHMMTRFSRAARDQQTGIDPESQMGKLDL